MYLKGKHKLQGENFKVMHTGNRLSRSWWGTGQEEIIDFIFGLHGKTGGMIEEFKQWGPFHPLLGDCTFLFSKLFFS
jgi:hypothetical protein